MANTKRKIPEVGDIARCKHGQLGIVTHVDYVGFQKMFYGLYLENNSDHYIGSPWQSSDPSLILTKEQLAKKK